MAENSLPFKPRRVGRPSIDEDGDKMMPLNFAAPSKWHTILGRFAHKRGGSRSELIRDQLRPLVEMIENGEIDD